MNVILNFKRDRSIHPFETDTKGRYSSSLMFLLTGHLAEGVPTTLLDTKEGNLDAFTSSGKCSVTGMT